MRKLITVVAALLISGCGAMDPLRGHNISMAIDGVQALRKDSDEVYDEKAAQAETPEEEEEVEQERARAQYNLDDVEDRLRLAQRDFPAPKVKKGEEPVKRGTLEEPSEEDRYRRNAYAGEVFKREARRKAWERFRKAVLAPFAILGWVLDLAIYAIAAFIIVMLIIFGRRVYGIMIFLIRLLPEIVPDKEKRRKIAGGTPVEKVYHREKRKNGKSKIVSN